MRDRVGFSGERLRDARVLRGWTGTALAERVGVTSGALSQYESGQSEPRPAIRARLAEVLSVPDRYFLAALTPSASTPFLFRSQAAATKRAREASSVRLKWMHEISTFLDERVVLPNPDLPSWKLPTSPELLDTARVDRAAQELRTVWGLGMGPISNMTSLLEAKGIAVGLFSFNAEKQDSVSKAEPQRSLVAVNADAVTYVRARYDLAHELGHLVLHREVPRLTASQGPLHALMEDQAHQFAGEFLFPEKRFRDEVYSVAIAALLPIKRRWGVSVQMLQRRAYRLGLIGKPQYQRACIEISRRGLRRSEPLDDSTPVEAPQVFRTAFELLAAQNETRIVALDGLPLPQADVEVICGLQPGFFTATDAEILPLRIKPHKEGQPENTKPGELVPFQRK
ncbi:MAG: XRE family transcriptional regulator [Thermoanaerobaculia bacterium]|nr:XRE family transcriptional regulator [Thermoanaerobaculia bacterium]